MTLEWEWHDVTHVFKGSLRLVNTGWSVSGEMGEAGTR